MPSEHPTKATSYNSIADLKKLPPEALDTLDFADFQQKFGSEALDELYPPNATCGKHYPAPSFLTSGVMVRQWRKMSDSDQKNITDAGARKEWVARARKERDARERVEREAREREEQISKLKQANKYDAIVIEVLNDSQVDDEKRSEPAELSVREGDKNSTVAVDGSHENKTVNAPKANTHSAVSKGSNIEAEEQQGTRKSADKSDKKTPNKANAITNKQTTNTSSNEPTKFAPYSAATYTFTGLKILRVKQPDAFAVLNFNSIPLSQLDQLFPKLCGKGDQDPPEHYRSSQEMIEKWRSLSEDQQLTILASKQLLGLKQKSGWRKVKLKVGKEVKKLGLTLRFLNDTKRDDNVATGKSDEKPTDATSDDKSDVNKTKGDNPTATVGKSDGKTTNSTENGKAHASDKSQKVEPNHASTPKKINPKGGFVIGMSLSCPFQGQINIGDRLLSINGMEVASAEDCAMFANEERTFEFEISEENSSLVAAAAEKWNMKANILSGKKRSGQDLNAPSSKRSMSMWLPQVTRLPKGVYQLPAPHGLQALGLSFEFPQGNAAAIMGSGAFVYGIHPRSTLRGKVQIGDKLVAIDGSSVNTPNDLDNRKCEMLLTFEYNLPDSKNQPCRGISLATLDSRRVAEIDKIKDGFQHQVACALRYKALYLESHGKWDGGPGIAGYLVKFVGVKKKEKAVKTREDEAESEEEDFDNESTPGAITWICRVSFDAAGAEVYSFHRPDCIGGKSKTGLCERCNKGIHGFYVMCKAQATKHAKGVVGDQHIDLLVYESPSFLTSMLRRRIKQTIGLMKKIRHAEHTVVPLKKENEKLRNQLKVMKGDISQSVAVLTRKKTFPVMLHELVSAVSVIQPSVINWSPCGNGFFIHNKSTEVLQPFFQVFLKGLVLPSGTEQLDYRTFHRKIRGWNFEPGEGALEGGHCHPNFRRDMASKEELYTIKRRKLPKKPKSAKEEATAAEPPPETEPLPPCHTLSTWNPWCHELGEGWTCRDRTRKHYNKTEKWTQYISPRGRQFDTKAAARRYINSEAYAEIERIDALVKCATCGHFSCVEQNNFSANRWSRKVSSMSIPAHVIPCGRSGKNVPCKGNRVFKESTAVLVDNGEYDRIGIRECTIVLLDMMESNGYHFMLMDAEGEWEFADYKMKFDKAYDALKYVKKKRKREAAAAAAAAAEED